MMKEWNTNNSQNKMTTYSLRCKSCGSIMNIQSEKRLLQCPSCGSEEIIIESDSVTIERIRSSTQLTMQREKREYEREKRIYEDNKAEKKDKEGIRLGIKFILGMFVFALLFFIITDALKSIKTNVEKNSGRINPPISAQKSVGEDYHLIEQQFRDAGFINVTARPLNDIKDISSLEALDLEKSSLGKYINEDSITKYNARIDKIETIMIGSQISFSSSDWFSPDTNVYIYYHSMEDSSL